MSKNRCNVEILKENDMKTIEQVREETKMGEVFIGEVFTLEEFMEVVERGSITEYDGIGYFHDGEQETALEVFSPIWFNYDSVDEVIEKFPYVVWYNK